MKLRRTKYFVLLGIIFSLNFSGIAIMVTDAVGAIGSPVSGGGMGVNTISYSDWNQNITVGMDGSLLIVEEQTFQLDSGYYSYAFRTLKWNNFHDLNYWSIESANDAPPITSHSTEKDLDTIIFNWQWGSTHADPSDKFTFILTYNVSSAMDLRGNRDRVYWNVIGGEFEYYIFDIDTTVIFPEEYNVSDIRTTTYYKGKDPGDDLGTVSNVGGKTIVTYHQSSVAPHESYTIDTDSPPAGIDMPFSWRVYFNQNWVLVFAIAFVPIFLFFLIAFFVKGKDPRVKHIPTLNEIIIKKCTNCGFKDMRKVNFCPQCGSDMKSISEVGPPGSLTPAEVGVLLDEKFDNIDFVAEFFYLAEQGYLKIVQIPDEDEIYFMRTEKNTPYGGLSKFDGEILKFVEKYSYDHLNYDQVTYTDNKEKVESVSVEATSLSTIKRNIVSLWTHKKDVYNKLAGGDTKYFDGHPEKVKSRYVKISIFTGVVGSLGFYAISYLFHVSNLVTAIVGVVAASFIGLILSKWMPKLTKYGVTAKASWQSYLQLIRGEMLGFPDPYEQFNFSMEHFSYLLVDPGFNLPQHLRHISQKVKRQAPPKGFHFVTPYWYFYPHIMYSPGRGISHRTITGFDGIGRGFESVVSGISNLAESLPEAISNLSEGVSSAISSMSEGFTPPSSSGGSSGFGGGFSGGGGGGGGGGIG